MNFFQFLQIYQYYSTYSSSNGEWNEEEYEIQCIQFEMIYFVAFGNGHYLNIVSTLTDVVKLDFENGIVVLTLSTVVHLNVDMHNVDLTFFGSANFIVDIHSVVSTLIWRCLTLSYISSKRLLKQCWNVCWVKFKCGYHVLHILLLSLLWSFSWI